jgi:hypothetical protein
MKRPAVQSARGRGHASANASDLPTLCEAFFIGTWPTFNTLAALGVNVAVLVALLGLHWPPVHHRGDPPMDEPVNLVLFSGTDDKLQAAAVLTVSIVSMTSIAPVST